jgi:predicted nucleotidyltransferase
MDAVRKVDIPLTEEQKRQIKALAARHGASNVRIFGSFARGEVRAHSDVDILVDVGAETSSWFPAGLIVDLQKLLGRPVDVVTERGLNPFLRDTVMGEARPL